MDCARVLIVDDEESIRSIIRALLEEEGYVTSEADSGREALERAGAFNPDLVLLDLIMPDIDGAEVLPQILETCPECKVIIVTAHGTIRSAVDAMKEGAYDYITKPFDNDELLLSVRRALEARSLKLKVEELQSELKGLGRLDELVGVSDKMHAVFEQVMKVSSTEVTVLITGETGTGKELIVRAIHTRSKRKDGPLVVVNCGAVPHSLIEAEFFGYEKGAFTDAREARAGKFELANGGTLFLDEVSELPLESQVKLLRAIQEKEITRLGGNRSIRCDVRVIAATNKDLAMLVEGGAFREDLYWRLNVVSLFIPPLRERREDIPVLVDHFLARSRKQLGIGGGSIAPKAMKLLEEYSWPGNVRELENAIHSALLMASGGLIRPENLPSRIRKPDEVAPAGTGAQPKDLKQSVAETERQVILRTLEECGGNRSEAARRLGISRKTLFNKMRALRLNDA